MLTMKGGALWLSEVTLAQPTSATHIVWDAHECSVRLAETLGFTNVGQQQIGLINVSKVTHRWRIE